MSKGRYSKRERPFQGHLGSLNMHAWGMTAPSISKSIFIRGGLSEHEFLIVWVEFLESFSKVGKTEVGRKSDETLFKTQ